jgi:hypothetical protein
MISLPFVTSYVTASNYYRRGRATDRSPLLPHGVDGALNSCALRSAQLENANIADGPRALRDRCRKTKSTGLQLRIGVTERIDKDGA